jgi:hypothetical protein
MMHIVSICELLVYLFAIEIQIGELKVSKWGELKFCPFATQGVQTWAKMSWGRTGHQIAPPPLHLHAPSLSHSLIK